jgi:hypothetical protein
MVSFLKIISAEQMILKDFIQIIRLELVSVWRRRGGGGGGKKMVCVWRETGAKCRAIDFLNRSDNFAKNLYVVVL